MIRGIKHNKSVREWSNKKNWADQFGVVFGYQNEPFSCEYWGWGVFDAKTHARVADSPEGLPYHFDFDSGAAEAEYNDLPSKKRPNSMFEKREGEFISTLDVVRVRLLSDVDGGRPLVFEAFTDHDGFYMHSFSFARHEFVKFVYEGKNETGLDSADKPPEKPATVEARLRELAAALEEDSANGIHRVGRYATEYVSDLLYAASGKIAELESAARGRV